MRSILPNLCVQKNLLVEFLTVSDTFQEIEAIPKIDAQFSSAIDICLKRNIHEVSPVNVGRQILDAFAWAIETAAVKVEDLSEDWCSNEALIYLAGSHVFIVTSSLYHLIDLYSRHTRISVAATNVDEVIEILKNEEVLTFDKECGKSVWSMKRTIKGGKDGRRFVKIKMSILFPTESDSL